jgi:hypothetical protein
MSKRTFATIGGVIAATLLVAGIAWASGSDDSVTSTSTPSTSTSLDDNGSSTSIGDSTSTSLQGQTSTTIDDNISSTIDDDDRGKDDDVTGTTIDDDDDDDTVAVPDGAPTYQVPGAGNVTINVSGGALELANVQVNAGWTFEVDEARPDQIKVKFRNGESEAEFEAELEHGGLSIDIEQGA